MDTKHKEKTNPNKLKPEEYSSSQMLGAARAYLKAAKLCNDPPVKQMGWVHPLLVPMATNLAFSIELLLKTVLNGFNSPIKGHNLFELFESLPEEAKKNIIGLDDKQDFLLILKQNSCLFEEWRYIYERQPRSINISFLFDFAERLSCYAEQLF